MKDRSETYLLFMLLLVLAIQVRASEKVPVDSVKNNFIEQLNIYPQEKIHIQTDKADYMSGENVWFRAFLVDGVLHQPVFNSRYVYVELINPLDTVVYRVKIKQTDSVYNGYIPLFQDLPEGEYSIRAYTYFMRNQGEDYFFRKNIRIGTPQSAKVRIDIDFTNEKKDKVSAKITFKDIVTERKIKPKEDDLVIKINNNKIYPLYYKVGKDSIVDLSFDISQKDKSQVMYVEYDTNKKFTRIPAFENDYDVSFFPEGGYLLQGTGCTVAFKALKSNGQSERITGEIFDGQGNKMTDARSNHLGMGSFAIKPEPGKTYYAVCRNEEGIEKRFEIPQGQSNTYSLQTRWIKNRLAVSVKGDNNAIRKGNLNLLIHSRGIVQYAGAWDESKDYISFERGLLLPGVLQVLLLDEEMNILSERLAFCANNNEQGRVSFSTDKPQYRSRDHIQVKLEITDQDDIPLEGSFSVAVTDDHDIAADTCSSILTSLLLTSELKGYIESPAYYFTGNKDAENNLDILMMTQGWRRYNIPGVIKGEFEYPVIPLEVGPVVSGTVKGLVRQKAVEKSMIIILSRDGSYSETTETDENGRFYFDNHEGTDSTEYIIQALSAKGKNTVELYVDRDTFPAITQVQPVIMPQQSKDGTISEDEELFEAYIAKADKRWTIENGIRTIHLSEVVIKKKVNKKSMYAMGSNSQSYDENFFKTHAIVDAKSLSYSIPGLSTRVFNDGVERFIFNRNMTSNIPAVVVVDDMIMFGDFDINNIVIFDIEKVDVVKGVSLLLGSPGGAVIITTKKGDGFNYRRPVFNLKHLTPLGYQQPVEFYAPKYENAEQRNGSTPDLRTTIYWNPNVAIEANGMATFDLYSADLPSTYSVIIEGVSYDGTIFRCVKKIKVR